MLKHLEIISYWLYIKIAVKKLHELRNHEDDISDLMEYIDTQFKDTFHELLLEMATAEQAEYEDACQKLRSMITAEED